jgi:rhodanese-related sulfurtransferase
MLRNKESYMNRLILPALLLLCGSAISIQAAACDSTCATSPAPAFADIAATDLKAGIAGKTVVLVDANGSASFAKGRLPGAIDFKANANDLAKVLPADKGALIVAYCGGPKCGAWKGAAEAIAKLGYTNVKHFSGGLKGWQEAGEKLEPTL